MIIWEGSNFIKEVQLRERLLLWLGTILFDVLFLLFFLPLPPLGGFRFEWFPNVLKKGLQDDENPLKTSPFLKEKLGMFLFK